MDAICETNCYAWAHHINKAKNSSELLFLFPFGMYLVLGNLWLVPDWTVTGCAAWKRAASHQAYDHLVHACRCDLEHRSLGALELPVNGGVCERSQLGRRRDISHGVPLAYGICADRPGFLDLPTLGEAS